ncbi:hypothetical protein [Halolamina litorea]|uniref:SHOCT domain-containing protein n=1 Tax=Halolamina litorea TaxID=1515593 RepID=A0ABD6BMI2_9EURY|nr:hypothetical protein [Halolamina litorea]
MVSRRWLYAGGAAGAAVLAVVVALLGVADAITVLAGATAAENVLLAAFGEVIEWFAGVFVLAVLAVVLFAATMVSTVRQLSVPRNARLAAVVARFERWVPPLGRIGAAERLAPTTTDRRAELAERYVDGDVDEATLERELDDLLVEEVERERERELS